MYQLTRPELALGSNPGFSCPAVSVVRQAGLQGPLEPRALSFQARQMHQVVTAQRQWPVLLAASSLPSASQQLGKGLLCGPPPSGGELGQHPPQV